MSRTLAAALLVLAAACGRSEGVITLRPGMSRDAAQRASTIALKTYGDSGRRFDFVLAGEAIRFGECVEYMISTDSRDRIESFSVHSANESWPQLLREVRRTEELLLARGWRYGEGGRTVRSLPADARAAAVTTSGAVDAFHFTKGSLELTLTAAGKWGGVPRWRSARRSRSFWRSITVSVAGR